MSLRWELSRTRHSQSCPFEHCGELVKYDPLDTPPRSFMELAEVRPVAGCSESIVCFFPDLAMACRLLSPPTSRGNAAGAVS